MPNKPKLPRNAKRLPAGTTRHDYDPEVYAEWNRDRCRQRKERQRKRQHHRGYRDVSFFLGQDARAALNQLRNELAMSGSQVITFLLMEATRHEHPEQPEREHP